MTHPWRQRLFSRQEVREILRRAAELQSQAEGRQEPAGSSIRWEALEAGAIAAGIRGKFLKQAIREFQRKRGSGRQKGKGFFGQFLKWVIVTPFLLFGFGIAGIVIFFTILTVTSVLVALLIALVALGGIFLGMFGPILLIAIGIGATVWWWMHRRHPEND